jgi:hypothetical protein
MRRLIAATLLAFAMTAAQAADPTYQDKFAQYVEFGWSPEEICAGLTRWFGKTFEIEDYNGERFVIRISRAPDMSVWLYETIGKLPP